jgi:hypothetical protein
VLAGCRGILGIDEATVAGDAAESFDGDGDGDGGVDAPTDPAGRTRTLTVDATRVTGGPHIDFPLLVSLTLPDLAGVAAGGDVVDPAGNDIGFFSGVTRLAHEIELYDSTIGTLVAWVRLPALAGGEVIELRYGDPAATTNRQDAPAVWSGGYAGVWHLGANLDDSRQGSPAANGGTTVVAGQIASARAFDGNNDSVDGGAGIAIANIFNGGGTVEVWLFANSGGEAGFGRILDKGQYAIGMCDGNGVNDSLLVGRTFSVNATNWCTNTNTMPQNAWVHVAIVYDDTNTTNDPTVYIDGVVRAVGQLGNPQGAPRDDSGDSIQIGNRQQGDRAFDGNLDELRLSPVARSAAYVTTTLANQRDPGAFVMVGPEQ